MTIQLMFESWNQAPMFSLPHHKLGELQAMNQGVLIFGYEKMEGTANSNIRCVLQTDQNKDVIVNQTMMPFQAGDVINVMMAVEKTGEGLGIEAIKTQGRPLIPSIIFSMHKIKEETVSHWISVDKGTKKMLIEK